MSRQISTLTPDISDEQMLTTGDVAAILRCERTKAQRLLVDGTIEGAVRVGSRFLISAGALRAWLKAEQLPKNREVYHLRQTLRSKFRRCPKTGHGDRMATASV